MGSNLAPQIGDSCKKTSGCSGILVQQPSAAFLECSICKKREFYVVPTTKQNKDQ